MRCGQIQKMLPAFLEGLPSKTENALVEEHLASCESCRAAFEEYQKARQLIGSLEEVEPPPGFAQRVMARVEEEERKRAGVLRKLFYPLHIKVPIQAVAVAAVAVLAIQAYRAVEPQRQTSPETQIASAPEARGEPGKREGLREEAVRQAEKTLPASEQPGRTGEGPGKDLSPASTPPSETRLREEKAAARLQTPSGPAAPGEADKAESASGKRAKLEATTAAPAPSSEAASPGRKAEIGLGLITANPFAAAEKVRAIFQEIGGSRVETSRQGESATVTAELNAERLPFLLDLLKPLGEIKEKPRVSEPAAPFVSVRIELFRK